MRKALPRHAARHERQRRSKGELERERDRKGMDEQEESKETEWICKTGEGGR